METELELRHQSLVIAQSLENYGSVGNLLTNADTIYCYLTSQSTTESTPSESSTIAFIEKLSLQHPIKGRIPFKLWEHQKRIINNIDESPLLIINTARQMGVTKTLLAHALYEAATKPSTKILWLSDTFTHVLSSFKEIAYMMSDSDISVTAHNKASIDFSNGSSIIGRAVTWAEIGSIYDRVYIDNAAYISHRFFAESWPGLNLSKSIIMASTPNVMEGIFYDTWVSGGYPWRKLMLQWHEHPERDNEWAEREFQTMSSNLFAQEYCCSFRAKPKVD